MQLLVLTQYTGKLCKALKGISSIGISQNLLCVTRQGKARGMLEGIHSVCSLSQVPRVSLTALIVSPGQRAPTVLYLERRREAGKNTPSIQTDSSSSIHSSSNTCEKTRWLRSVIWQRHSTVPITDSQEILYASADRLSKHRNICIYFFPFKRKLVYNLFYHKICWGGGGYSRIC